MATITTNTTITLPAGQMLVFGLGGSATAIIDGNVYDIGQGEKFFGPFTQTESVQVVVRAGTITYNIETDGFASRDILQDPITRQLTPDSADAVRGAVNGGYQLAVAAGVASQKSMNCVQPSVALYDAVSNKTFFAYLGRDRDLMAGAYDHSAQQFDVPVFVASYSTFPEDDHGVPSMDMLPDGRLVVIYGSHDNNPKLAVSNAGRNITAWTVRTVTEIVGTYFCLAVDQSDGAVYVMGRAGSGHGATYPSHRHMGLWKSTNAGTSFADLGSKVNTTGYTANVEHDWYPADLRWHDGRLYFAGSVAAGDGHDGTRQDILMGWIRTTDAHVMSMSGVSLGTSVSTSPGWTALRIYTSSPLYCLRIEIVDHSNIGYVWNKYTAGGIEQWIGHWNGSNFAATNTGLKGRHNFDAPGIRSTELGAFEYYLMVGRTDEAPVFHGRDEQIAYVGSGNDLWLVTSATGRAVDSARELYPMDAAEGQGFHYAIAPRRSRDDLKIFVQGAASQGSQYGGNMPQRMPLYAIMRSPRPQYVAPAHPAVCVQHINRPGVAYTGISLPFDAWQLDKSIAAFIPRGCLRVLLMVTIKGTGTAGKIILRLRSGSTEGTSGQIIIHSRGEWDEFSQTHWLPVSEDGLIDLRWSGTSGALSTVEFHVCGYEV
jgi:BNR repeat-containing family member